MILLIFGVDIFFINFFSILLVFISSRFNLFFGAVVERSLFVFILLCLSIQYDFLYIVFTLILIPLLSFLLFIITLLFLVSFFSGEGTKNERKLFLNYYIHLYYFSYFLRLFFGLLYYLI